MMNRTLLLAGVLAGWTVNASAADPSAPATAVPAFPKSVPLLPAVRTLLDRAANYYAAHNTFEADLTSVTRMDASGMKQEFDSSFHLALQRPNLIALTLQGGMMGGSAISNGKTLITTMPMARRYTTADAPAQLADMFGFGHFSLMLALGGLPVGFEHFFETDPDASFGQQLMKSEDLGAEPVNGQPAHHVRLTSMGYVTDFWIADGEQPLLLQAGVIPDMSGAFAHLSAAQKAKMPPGLGSMKMSRVTTYTDWKIDQPIAPSVFDVKPPDGFTVMNLGAGAEKPHPLAGKSAPDFTLQDLDGRSVSLKSLRGKVVVLDFWATWCGPCVASLPLVTSVASSFKDQGVVFYAANQREDAAVIRKFQADKGLTFPVLLDPEGKAGGLYQALAIPETVLIDRNGKIQAVHVGYNPQIKTLLSKQLTDILAGKQLPTAPAAAPSAP